jgi:hypothetical protein
MERCAVQVVNARRHQQLFRGSALYELFFLSLSLDRSIDEPQLSTTKHKQKQQLNNKRVREAKR